MISKELLSEVLGINIDGNDIYIKNNYIYYAYCRSDNEWINASSNIYELAHKCKEWAYKQKRVNMFFVENDIENFAINVGVLYGEQHPNLNMHYFSEDNCEIKSIIKACEWILKQKGNK